MRAYARLIAYLRPYWGLIVVTWMASLLILALSGLSIWVAADFVEKVLLGETIGGSSEASTPFTAFLDRVAAGILQRSTEFRSLLAGVAVLSGCVLSVSLLRIFKHFAFAVVNQSILVSIRNEMFTRLTHLDLSFSNKNKPGEISSLFIQDTEQLNHALVDVADRLFMQPVRLIFALVLMVSLSWRLTAWTVPFFIASAVFVHYAGARIERMAKAFVERIAHLQGHLTEYVSTVIIARAFNREDHERSRFNAVCNDLKKAHVTLTVAGAVAPQVVRLVWLLAGGVLLLIGGNEVFVRRSISGSTLVKMMLLLPMATYAMESLASLYVSMRATVASAKRVFALIDEPETDVDAADAIEVQRFERAIEFDHVSYSVDGTEILSDLSFVIPKGRTVVIFGPSGVGKTTLLSLIARFTRCTAGAISVDGVDLKRLRGASWRRMLGIVTQVPTLINGTLRDNLLYVCPHASDEELQDVLRKALLWDVECRLPKGLDTMAGNRGDMMSGGERQRVTIARALLNDPDILLLDEPTSMLDQDNRGRMVETIERIAEGRTVVIATHDARLRRIADVELVLESRPGDVRRL